MKAETVTNKLGIIKKGKYKNTVCIILKEYNYLNTDSLKYYTVLKDNIIFKINCSSVKIL